MALEIVVSVLFGRGQSSSRKAPAILAAGALVMYALWRRRRCMPRGKNCTIIRGHWLLGHLPDFVAAEAKKEHYKLMTRMHEEFGKTIICNFPLTPWWVVTTNPENVEWILKTNFENYPKGDFLRSRMGELLGDGIFNIDGHAWYAQRKISSQMFTANLFKEHIWVVVQRNTQKVLRLLQSAQADKAMDIFNVMNRFTLDTIGEIGFGKSIGSMEDPTSPFLVSFDRAQQITYQRFYFPGWRLMQLLRIGYERDGPEHFERLDRYSRQVIGELRETLKSDVANKDESRKSFLGFFMADAQKRGEELTDDFLRDLTLNFLIAGRDTTAQALAWTCFSLCTHPEVESKARQEVLQVCGRAGPTLDKLGKLSYLQAVVNEALRLYPSVPIDVKQALNEDVLPDGTFVPQGSAIVYNMYGMGRDTDLWGEDAAQFRPERWLEDGCIPSNYKYPIFNAGPRECLGRRLAILEMKACLVTLLSNFRLQMAVPAEEITIDTQLTIGMASGLPCYVHQLTPKDIAGCATPSDISRSETFATGSEAKTPSESEMSD